jgi:hypothetical protein
MTNDQLRKALGELNAQRDACFVFIDHGREMVVRHAMLIPDEADHLVKVSDGKSIFIIDAERVAWVQIG